MSLHVSHYAQVIETDVPLVGTARIGAELRQVRERLGWNLADIAAELRIREPFLEAIEFGRLEDLPGPAYQIGFIRAYAQILGLDGNEILRRFRAEGVGKVKKPELSFLAPVPDRAVPSGAIVLLGVVVLLVGYGLWFLHTENDQTLAASVPPVPAQLAPLAVPPAPPKPAPMAATPPVKAAAPGPAAPGATSVTTAAATAAPSAAVAPAPKAKTIMATADTWVEVKDANGNILFSRVMHSGDSWPVPEMPGLTMTAGNAGGTEIAGNGNSAQPLGATGTVLRSYALTPGAPTTPPASGATPQPATPSPAQTPASAH